MSSHKSTPPRTVALCYIRMSMLAKNDTSLAPDRQKAYIEAACHENGWTPEWFEDVGGHRSGRSDAHRPEWAKLWLRLGDPDIAAVVAYDLARLYRHGERITTFVNVLRMNDIRLVLANPLKSFDTQDDKNHQLLNLISMIDEMYAEDIRESILTSVDYRRSQGMHVGSIPFGTERNADGYLIPSRQGAWLLPDKTYVAGSMDDRDPYGGEWRGFYDALVTMYQLFVDFEYSQDKIARELNQLGYRYRDRQGKLTLFERDDIRRSLSNWPEYGGYRGGGRAWGKERHALDVLPEDYQLNPDLAVLPLALLKAVAERRRDISHRPTVIDKKRKSEKFALSHTVLCAHCHKTPLSPDGQLYLWGRAKTSPVALVYTHNNQPCSVKKRSVQQRLLHKQFLELVQSLSITEDVLLQWQAKVHSTASHGQLEQEEKQTEQALKSLEFMASSGYISLMDLKERFKKLKLEQKRLQQLREQHDRLVIEDSNEASNLVTTALALRQIVERWNEVEDDERYQLVKRVFEWICYDLDREEITEFKMVESAAGYLAALVRTSSDE